MSKISYCYYFQSRLDSIQFVEEEIPGVLKALKNFIEEITRATLRIQSCSSLPITGSIASQTKENIENMKKCLKNSRNSKPVGTIMKNKTNDSKKNPILQFLLKMMKTVFHYSNA